MRRVTILTAMALAAAGCGSWWTGTAGTGGISGTVGVSVALARVQAKPGPISVASSVRRIPMNAPVAAPDELLVKLKPGASLQAVDIHRQVGAIEVKVRLP